MSFTRYYKNAKVKEDLGVVMQNLTAALGSRDRQISVTSRSTLSTL